MMASNLAGYARTTFFLIALAAIAAPSWGASTFVGVPLGKGASIEVPRNWVVFSTNKRTTIDAFVEAKGLRNSDSRLDFAANLYDDQGQVMALVNVRFQPENPLTQIDARQATRADLAQADSALRQATEAALKAEGRTMGTWYGVNMRSINGLHVLVHEHRNIGPGSQSPMRVRGLRVWASPRSFTVTLAYREVHAELLLPIIDYMMNSLRQD